MADYNPMPYPGPQDISLQALMHGQAPNPLGGMTGQIPAPPPTPFGRRVAPVTGTPSYKGAADNVHGLINQAEGEANAAQVGAGEGYRAYTDSGSALKDLLQSAVARLQQQQVAPSPQEQRLKAAAAMFGGPGINTGMGGGFARMANSQVDQAQAAREAEVQKQAMVTKYQLESGQIDMQQAMARIQQSLGQQKAAEDRSGRLATAEMTSQMKNETGPIHIDLNTGQPQVNDTKVQADYASALAKQRAIQAGFNPESIEKQAELIASGHAPMFTGISATRPGSPGLLMNQRAAEISMAKYGQTLDGTTYQARQKAQDAFATGDNAKTINSLGVGMQHLGTLGAVAEQLDNDKGSKTMNALYQAVQKEFGLKTAPTTFDAAMDIVRAEIPKAIIGAGRTALADRQEAETVLSRIQNPQQFKEALGVIERLFAGQLTGQRAWYERAVELGRPSGEFDSKFLGGYPGALAILRPLEATGQVQPREVSDSFHMGEAAQLKPTPEDIAYLRQNMNNPNAVNGFKRHFGYIPQELIDGSAK